MGVFNTEEIVLTTTVADYRATIAKVFHILHSLPPDAKSIIQLPSVRNYRAFWFPVDEELYPNNTITPISRQKKKPTARSIIVTNSIVARQNCDVLVTLKGVMCCNPKKLIRIQITEVVPKDLLSKPHRLRIIEDKYMIPSDLQGVSLKTLQTNVKVKHNSFH